MKSKQTGVRDLSKDFRRAGPVLCPSIWLHHRRLQPAPRFYTGIPGDPRPIPVPMSEPHDALPQPPPLPTAAGTEALAAPPPREWRRRLIAWAVICLCVALAMIRVVADKKATAEASARSMDAMGAATSGRYVVGMKTVFGKLGPGYGMAPEQIMETFEQQAKGSANAADRFRLSILQGEILGAEPALATLSGLTGPESTGLDARQFEVFRQLESLYRRAGGEAEPPPVTPAGEAEPVTLEKELGWYGRLAQAYGRPDDDPARRAVLAEAKRTFLGVLAGFVALVGVFLLGALMSCLALALFVKGTLRWRFAEEDRPRLLPAGSVWLEAFAVYLGLMVLGGLFLDSVGSGLTKALAGSSPGGAVAGTIGLVLGLGGMGLALAGGLLWPRWRGLRGADYRRGFGWTKGRGVLREMVAGALGYLAGLPLLAAGFSLTLILVSLTQADASHPLNHMAQAPAGLLMLMGGLAVVWAPLTEETFFRGALFSAVRGGMGRWVGGLITGVIFAAVHPQGWTAIPALASIGLVLALLREWRGSLIAPITAHALSNGTLLAMMLLLLR